jgi:protein-tyrosine kinase
MSRIDDAMERAAGRATAPKPDADRPQPEPPAAQPPAAQAPTDAFGFADAADEFREPPSATPPPAPEPPRPPLRPATVAAPAASLPARVSARERAAWLERLVTHPQADPATTDQFRKLAATLRQLQIERAARVVMISSALAAEGKTLTATNLALTLCESYDRRVLLIDADLRRPSLHAVFGEPLSPGLTDIVAGGSGTGLPVVQVSPRLSVLTAGSLRHDPVTALSSDRMHRLLLEASSAYDWVILDTSPVGMLPDAHLLSGMVDAVVMVVRVGASPYQVVQRAAESVGPERIVGVVLNHVTAQEFSTAYPDRAYYSSRAS